MVQIIPRNRPTFGEQLMSGLQGGIQSGQQLGLQSALQKQQYAQQLGLQREKAAHELELQKSKLAGEYQADKENFDKIKNAFGEKFADVWLASPTGARTALTQAALEARARGIDLDKILSIPEVQENLGISPSVKETERRFESPEEFQVFDELSQIKGAKDEGLLPEERISRGKERYTTGLKEYQEAGTKLHGMARDKERLDILDDLNKTTKLPKGLGRINVDKEGNLRAPFVATPEAQRFVKTLNEFSSSAKDTFGSRVTNFDLAQYLKRFPTLLNTQEGRRQLVDQMKLVNQINSVYYKNLRKVYDEAGGVREIDSDVASRLAEKLSEPMVNKLSSKFKEIGQFSSRPNPQEFKGKRIRDKETGEVFISDGTNWIPE